MIWVNNEACMMIEIIVLFLLVTEISVQAYEVSISNIDFQSNQTYFILKIGAT